ncbi:hypothetical protein [Photobacterium sanguinicancri]|uniref:Glycine zipper domain-containing protein n=1 Tax=Photobacterium sanguinicancri TaxID=875932 RepID=A0ABX4FTH2_9GAMM|nr:hypothetical protein [Photobacterium sanguinicancri]OZS42113.1 hypothetical protein ASV53_20145 [Photobacterium sanguinicancri]
MEKRAVSVHYPDKDKDRKVEVDFSLNGAKKGCAIGLVIASRIPHPAAIPIGLVVGGILGGVFGSSD